MVWTVGKTKYDPNGFKSAKPYDTLITSTPMSRCNSVVCNKSPLWFIAVRQNAICGMDEMAYFT